MLFYLIPGALLGLSAGIAPGPLMALVISQALTYGTAEGVKVALAPLVTDPPIIFLSLVIGAQLASNPVPFGILSLAGAVYISYLAWQSATLRMDDPNGSHMPAKSIQKGILTNFLNPHPYMFWITVGTPFLLKTWKTGPWGAVFWLASFYVMLVGSKASLSIFAGRSKKWLQGKGYLWLNRVLGLLLLFFAALLARDALILWGWMSI